MSSFEPDVPESQIIEESEQILSTDKKAEVKKKNRFSLEDYLYVDIYCHKEACTFNGNSIDKTILIYILDSTNTLHYSTHESNKRLTYYRALVKTSFSDIFASKLDKPTSRKQNAKAPTISPFSNNR